jgi:cell division inhibitor SulA
MRDGDTASARSSWGSSVCDWLDALTEGQRAELYEAAAEAAR